MIPRIIFAFIIFAGCSKNSHRDLFINNISTEQSEYDGYLVNRDNGLHLIEGYHISDSSLGIILVHGRYPDNWPSKGLEWSLAIKDIADRERPIWWFKHNWNDCPEYSSNNLYFFSCINPTITTNYQISTPIFCIIYTFLR